ncbi:MAG: tetratricopeptide repeat protein [Candidatus Zixiibacteriota bacterium]|nr:MAG: tetratricopeptide repeat protein [candidate division Zixibacteria bacterium]
MALKFICEHCKIEIVVRHLKVGEQALCRACGREMQVPLNAVETTHTPDNLNPTPLTPVPIVSEEPAVRLALAGKRAWSPKGIHWLSWFFSPLPAGIAWAINFEKLGQPEKKLGAFLVAVTLFVVVIAINFIPGFPRFGSILANGSCAALYYYTQKDLFRKFVEQGGQKASFKLPIINSVLFLIVFFGPLFAVVYHEQARIQSEAEAIQKLLDRGEYSLAEPRLRQLQRDDPERPEFHRALIVLYMNAGKYDSALVSVDRYLATKPGDSASMAVRNLALSHIFGQSGQFDSAIARVELYLSYWPDDSAQISRRNALRELAERSSQKSNSP